MCVYIIGIEELCGWYSPFQFRYSCLKTDHVKKHRPSSSILSQKTVIVSRLFNEWLRCVMTAMCWNALGWDDVWIASKQKPHSHSGKYLVKLEAFLRCNECSCHYHLWGGRPALYSYGIKYYILKITLVWLIRDISIVKFTSLRYFRHSVQ